MFLIIRSWGYEQYFSGFLVPKNDFKAVASPPALKEKPTTFSLRLTPGEKAYLTQKAGSR